MTYDDPKTKSGSARFSAIDELQKAGLLTGKGLHHGYTHEKRPRQIGFDAHTPSLVIGAAGTGKLTTHLAYQLLPSGQDELMVILDCKGELAAISNLSPYEARYYFNPYHLHSDAPWHIPTHHRFNILEDFDSESLTFYEDMHTIANGLINKQVGDGASAHFWGKAVMTSTAVLMDGKVHNPHFSLPDFYNVIGDLQGGDKETGYFDFHIERMKASAFSFVRSVAGELSSKREMVPAEFGSIMSTISNSIACLGSPALQISLSSPSTVRLSVLLALGQPAKIFLILPANLLEACAPVTRSFTNVATLLQQRNPQKPLHIVLDEAGQLKGGFDTLPRLYSFGRGSMTKVSAYYQNNLQGVACLGRENFDTIVANAQAKIILGCSSYEAGLFTSRLLGKTTYRYLAKSKQVDAHFRRQLALQQLFDGQEMSKHMLEIMKQGQMMHMPDSAPRDLMTPDEIMRMPADTGILDIHGVIHPYRYLKWPYFANPAVAHRFLPNPFHPPFDRISIPSRFSGMTSIPIITEKVPDEIAYLPQYNEYWSYPKGFNPLKKRTFSLFN